MPQFFPYFLWRLCATLPIPLNGFEQPAKEMARKREREKESEKEKERKREREKERTRANGKKKKMRKSERIKKSQ